MGYRGLSKPERRRAGPAPDRCSEYNEQDREETLNKVFRELTARGRFTTEVDGERPHGVESLRFVLLALGDCPDKAESPFSSELICSSDVIGFKIMNLARIEGEGCIVIRRRPITQPKSLS